MDINEFIHDWFSDSPYIKVHTSGSTGAPKEMHVEKSRMQTSAQMTCQFLGLHQGDHALLCMPVDYIAGKMMVVRSVVHKLVLTCVKPSINPLKSFCPNADSPLTESWSFTAEATYKHQGGVCQSAPAFQFAAMVPAQVSATLENEEESALFRKISNVIIGGGSIDAKLEEKLKDMPNAIWSTYGMTETLSHIAMRRISGRDPSLWYTPMRGVSVSLSADNTLVINAPSICPSVLQTNDIAEMNCHGQFRIIGRKDNIINSGGIKIQIEEVENALRRSLPEVAFEHFAITSCPDERFGEVVVILLEKKELQHVFSEAISTLPRYWRPKKTVFVNSLPKTESGKPDRATAKRIVAEMN